MAKLRDDRFLCPGGFSSDSITCLDIIMVKQLSNGACHSMLFKLIMAILRNESSEALRRRYGPNYIFGAFLCLLNFLSCYLTFVYVSVQSICIASELFPVLSAYACSGCADNSSSAVAA